MNLTIRDMRRGDLEEMEAWRPYRDPLHELWHIPRRAPLSRDIWFALHSSDPSRIWFTIERRQDAKVIGALSLREIIRPLSARLGIRLGPAFVDRGYGTEALRLFLPYYFQTLGLQRLMLDVGATNRRAIHVYRKLGFRLRGRHYRNVPREQDLGLLNEEQFRELRVYFRRHMGRMQLLFYDMELDRNAWEQQASQTTA